MSVSTLNCVANLTFVEIMESGKKLLMVESEKYSISFWCFMTKWPFWKLVVDNGLCLFEWQFLFFAEYTKLHIMSVSTLNCVANLTVVEIMESGKKLVLVESEKYSISFLCFMTKWGV